MRRLLTIVTLSGGLVLAGAAAAADLRGVDIPDFEWDNHRFNAAPEAPTPLPRVMGPAVPAQPTPPTEQSVLPELELYTPRQPRAPQMSEQLAILPDEKSFFAMKADASRYAPLQDLRLVADFENVTIQQAVERILRDATPKAGPWRLRWQLAEDNQYLLNERVNITAETTFDEFMAFLTERVINMSGVQLYTKVFDAGRVIVVSDSY